jgi:hypothetical protein
MNAERLEHFELVQAFFVVGAVYEARRPPSSGDATSGLLYTVRGELVAAAPRYRLLEGADGPERAALEGNFVKTRYEVLVAGFRVATITFPAVTLRKKLALALEGGPTYDAEGGVLGGVFRCATREGAVDLAVGKKLALRDTFQIAHAARVPPEVALLTAVAVHSRFYDVV